MERYWFDFTRMDPSFEEWLNPDDVRKLDGEELLRGLSGPSQPVTQRDFEEPQDSRDQSIDVVVDFDKV